jgi:hypothetical protein
LDGRTKALNPICNRRQSALETAIYSIPLSLHPGQELAKIKSIVYFAVLPDIGGRFITKNALIDKFFGNPPRFEGTFNSTYQKERIFGAECSEMRGGLRP